MSRPEQALACLAIAIISMGAALTLVACGGDGAPAGPSVPPKVTTQTGNAVSLTVGFSGGILTATAADGTTYTLEIPEGALAGPTLITMTPISAIAGFPVPDGLVGGLEFMPSGLVFAAPARLVIDSQMAPAAGEVPLAIEYTGDAEAFTAGFVVASAGRIVLPIRHFSGFGLAFGTTEDMGALLAGLPLTSAGQVYASELLLAWYDDPTAGVLHAEIMRRWFDESVLPGIVAASNDGELLTALNDFFFWMNEIPRLVDLFFTVPVEFASEIDEARAAFIPKLQAAVAGNNDLCSQAHNLDALRNVIFWQRQAGLLSIDTPTNSLDEATVRAGLCATLVIEGVSLPETMQVGFQHSLDFRLLMKFTDGTTQDVACAASITATNADVQNPVGNTDPFGNYTTVITATSNDAIEVVINGNVILPGETVPTIIQATFVIRNASGADFDGVFVSWGGYYDGVSREPVRVEVNQTQNAIAGTFESNAPGQTHGGSFSGTLSGTELLNASVTLDGCGGPFDVTASQFWQRPDLTLGIQLSWSGTDCHGHGAGSIDACGPAGELTLDSDTYGGFVIDYDFDGKTGVSGSVTSSGTEVIGSFQGEGGTFEFRGFLQPVSGTIDMVSATAGGCAVSTSDLRGNVTVAGTIGVRIWANSPYICGPSWSGGTNLLTVGFGTPDVCGPPATAQRSGGDAPLRIPEGNP